MRQLKLAINHNKLISLAMEVEPAIKNLTQNGRRSLIDRFMKSFGLSIRAVTSTNSSQDQIPPAEEEIIIRSFQQDILTTIQDHGIHCNEVFNMDQTSLNFELIPKKTIEQKGSQRVPILTKGGEKKRATIISLINADGQKFKQFIIMKGVFEARIHNALQEYNDEGSHFSAQKKAWTDETQLNSWLENIWWPIAQATLRPKILILDSYPLHQNLRTEFEKFNTIVKFIPKGLTWSLQPLDNLYHKTYKSLAREFFLTNQQRVIEAEEGWRNFLIECAKTIYGQIDRNIVKGSWKMAGLEYPVSNSEFERQDDNMIEIEEGMAMEEQSMIIEEEIALSLDS